MIKILFSLLIILSNIQTSKSNNIKLRDYRICNLIDQEVLLQFNTNNTVTKPIIIIDDLKGFIQDSIINTNTLTLSNYTINNTLFDKKHRIIAKQCSCNDLLDLTDTSLDYYCMNGNYCGVYRYNNFNGKNVPNVICFDFSIKLAFIKNAWPIVILWYIVIIVIFVSGSTGVHVRNYIKSFCYPNTIHSLVDHRRQQELFILRQQQLVLQRRRQLAATIQTSNTNGGMTTLNENEQLVLKIKLYYDNSKDECGDDCSITVETKEDEKENEEAVYCTICMIKINNGDRIGEIPCNHIFHTHCLKQWISRRNVCPLCLTPNIASTRTIHHNDTLINISSVNDPRYSSQPSLLLLAASGTRHNILSGNGIASGSISMIAETFMNLNSVTTNIQTAFFSNNRTGTENVGAGVDHDRNDRNV